MLLGAWTAFEVLISDLWITSLNYGPKALAEAVFTAATQQALKPEIDGKRMKESQAEEKTIPLPALKGRYDLRDKMGSLLADLGKVKFDSFTNTVRAYEAAFGKDAGAILDKSKTDCGNVAFLEAARNAIVHRGGFADAKFREKVQHATGSTFYQYRSLKDTDKLPIAGQMVAELIKSTMQIAVQLMKFVDSRMEISISEYEI
jgi:hypothetical protein